MSRIDIPASISEAPEASRPILEAIAKQAGRVPNFFRMLSNSPAALQGFTMLEGALGNGRIDRKTRERIALAVAELNGCDYCLAAHSYLGSIAKLDDAEITAARNGTSADPKADVALHFATRIVNTRGAVGASEVEAVRVAGFSDGEIVEIVALVALNTLTNYVNEALGTAIDFPVATKLAA